MTEAARLRTRPQSAVASCSVRLGRRPTHRAAESCRARCCYGPGSVPLQPTRGVPTCRAGAAGGQLGTARDRSCDVASGRARENATELPEQQIREASEAPPNSEPSRPALTIEERTTLCRCLNYEKLTLGACKDLAKSRRIPPGIAVQALASQQSKLQFKPNAAAAKGGRPDPSQTPRRVASLDLDAMDEKELLKLNLQKMQNRVVELERVCKEVRGQMSKMAKSKSFGTTSCHQIGGRDLPRLC